MRTLLDDISTTYTGKVLSLPLEPTLTIEKYHPMGEENLYREKRVSLVIGMTLPPPHCTPSPGDEEAYVRREMGRYLFSPVRELMPELCELLGELRYLGLPFEGKVIELERKLAEVIQGMK